MKFWLADHRPIIARISSISHVIVHYIWNAGRRAALTQQAGAAVEDFTHIERLSQATTRAYEPVYQVWNRGSGAWDDVSKREYETADDKSRRITFTPAATTASASECDRGGYHAYEVYSADGKQRCTICGVEWMGWPTAPSRDADVFGPQRWSKEAEMTESWLAHQGASQAPLGSAQLSALVDMYRKGAVLEDVFQRAAALARAPLPAQEPIAYVNRDELDNMLDDRTATIQTNPSNWRRTPLYAAPAQAGDALDAARYRAVRALLHTHMLAYYELEGAPEADIDSWVDAAMSASQDKTGGMQNV
jgi:hypothetical protein